MWRPIISFRQRSWKAAARSRPPPDMDDDLEFNKYMRGAGKLEKAVQEMGYSMDGKLLTSENTESNSDEKEWATRDTTGDGTSIGEQEHQWVRRAKKIKPGVVLVTQKYGHFDHFLTDSVILILEDHEERGTVGLLIDKNTPWEVGEMAPVFEDTKLSETPLSMGGGDGPDKLLMLHSVADLEGAKAIGDSGVYIGGVSAAVEATENREFDPRKFHFFFKRVEWLPGLLRDEVEKGVWELVENDRQKRLWNHIRSELSKESSKVTPVQLE
eukprot:jgi/Bigna1/129129/aug1.8_g3837